MNWREFQEAAPEMAGLAEERFQRTRVALVGTIRADGTPRVSPIEPVVADDSLLLGMMWRSQKALDLLRDPRCLIHSAITSLEGEEGELKLRGRAMEAPDPDVRERYNRVFREWWGARAPETFHVFAVEIESAAFIAYDTDKGEMIVKQWDPRGGLRETRRAYP